MVCRLATTRMTAVKTPIDDITIFAETPEGMQNLPDVVQEFKTWCGMEINIKKKSLLVVDKDRK